MKRKHAVSVFTALVLASSVGTVVGCSDADGVPPEEQTFTVTFYYNYDGAPNGGIYKTETVSIGTAVGKPADPTQPQAVFDCWSEEQAAGSVAWNFSTTVSADTDLYAQWITGDPIVDPVLTGIEVTTPPTKTTYTVGEALDMTGLVVTAIYGGERQTIDVASDMLSGYDMNTAGTQTVTVSYTEGEATKTATFTITVEEEQVDPPAPVALDGLEVTGENTYTVGDALDITVKAVYSDGGKATLEADDYTASGYDMNTAGEQTVTVTYTEGEITETATFDITVEEAEAPPAPVALSGIDVTTPPTKTTYTVGEALDITGLVVTATYSDGTTETVTVTTNMLSGYNMSATGEQTVTVTYTGEITKTATFTITVEEEQVDPPAPVALSSIDITTPPTKTTYTVGEALDITGLVVTATYSDNTTEAINVTVSMLSGYDMTTAGTQTVTVTYTEGEITETATFTITVEEEQVDPPAPVALSGIEVTTPPTKTTYTVGEALDITGLVVTATYSDNTTEAINVTVSMLSGYDMTTASEQTVTVTYTEGEATETATFTITVNNLRFDVVFDYGYNGAPDGGIYATVAVDDGEAVSEPSVPTRSGYTFEYWSLGGDEYDFDTPITGEITLVAVWRENPQAGWYMRVTYDEWQTSELIAITKGQNDYGATEYSAQSIGLVEGAIFYLVEYDANGESANEVKPSAQSLNNYITPSQLDGQIVFGTVSDDYGYNYTVEVYDASLADLVWNIYIQPGQVAAELVNTELRDPDGTANPDVASATEDKAVYIKGSFNGYNPSDNWSNASGMITTAVVGDKYYFTNVKLNKFDQFKIFVTADGDNGWYGISSTAFELGKEITLANGDTQNIFFGERSGYYDLAFDVKTHKLTVIAHDDDLIGNCVRETVYAGDVLTAADFAATANGEPIPVVLAGEAVAAVGDNRVKVIAGNTVIYISYTAQAVVATGIEITSAPDKTVYYTNETFDRAGMTVSMVYNNGDRQVVTDYDVSALPSYAEVNDMFTDGALVELTVSASIGGGTYTAKTSVTLYNVFVGLSVKPFEQTPTFFQGSAVTEIEGLVVYAVFNSANGERQIVTDYSLNVDTSSAGTTRAAVGLQGKTVEFDVIIVEVVAQSISVDSDGMPTYKIGQTVGKTGITVTAAFNDGSTREVTDYTVSADTSRAGDTSVTVRYAGLEKVFEITLGALNVTFECDGATYMTTQATEFDALLTRPIDPAKQHYDFAGWYTDGAFGNAWDFDADTVTDDITLYGKWTPVNYTVTLVLGGGADTYTVSISGNPDNVINAVYGTTVTLPSVVSVINNTDTLYTFLGWTLDLNADNVIYLPDGILVDGNITVYAHIDAVETRGFIFNYNDGTGKIDTVNVQIGKTPAAPVPARAGYEFGGWFDNAACTGDPYELNAVGAQTPTMTLLYAKWNIVTYTITLVGNGGSVMPEQTTYTVETATVTLPAPVREHYDFGGWCANGEAFEYEQGMTGDVTLTAEWTAIEYTLVYNVGLYGEAVASKTFTIETLSAVATLPDVVINAEGLANGYHSVGWYTAGEGGDSIASITAEMLVGINGTTVTVYALYELNEYTVTFDLDYDDAPTVEPVVVTHGEVITPPEYERENYTFGGWFAEGATQAFDFEDPITGDMAFTAEWTAIELSDGIYAGGRFVKQLEDNGSSGSRVKFKVSSVLLEAGAKITFYYNDDWVTEGVKVREKKPAENYMSGTNYDNITVNVGGYFDIYYDSSNVSNEQGLWVDYKGAYVAPELTAGDGLYNGNVKLMDFAVNNDGVNEVFAENLVLEETTTVTFMYRGEKVEVTPKDNCPTGTFNTDGTVTLGAGEYSFYLRYSDNALWISGKASTVIAENQVVVNFSVDGVFDSPIKDVKIHAWGTGDYTTYGKTLMTSDDGYNYTYTVTLDEAKGNIVGIIIMFTQNGKNWTAKSTDCTVDLCGGNAYTFTFDDWNNTIYGAINWDTWSEVPFDLKVA